MFCLNTVGIRPISKKIRAPVIYRSNDTFVFHRNALTRSDGGGQRSHPADSDLEPAVVRLSYTSCGSVRKRGLVSPPLRLLAAPAFRR